MKTSTTKTTGYKPGRFNSTLPVPAAPSPKNTVEQQLAEADRYLDDIRMRLHREIKRRNGQGKPAATDITNALLPGTQNVIMGIAKNNTSIIRMEVVEVLVTTATELVEYSHAQSAA